MLATDVSQNSSQFEQLFGVQIYPTSSLGAKLLPTVAVFGLLQQQLSLSFVLSQMFSLCITAVPLCLIVWVHSLFRWGARSYCAVRLIRRQDGTSTDWLILNGVFKEPPFYAAFIINCFAGVNLWGCAHTRKRKDASITCKYVGKLRLNNHQTRTNPMQIFTRFMKSRLCQRT